jgi:hypothetical protein
VEENHYNSQEEEPASSVLGATIYARSTSQNNFEEKSRDISPKKDVCGDALWSKYLAQAGE